MKLRALASLSVLASGLSLAVLPTVILAPVSAVAAEGGRWADFNNQLAAAHKALDGHDMAAAAKAIDAAMAMAHGDPKMEAMVPHLVDVKKMIMANDGAGAQKMLDQVQRDASAAGSHA